MFKFVTAAEAEASLAQLPHDYDYSLWDEEIRRIYGSNILMNLIGPLTEELKAGGLERYFLQPSGAGALLCVQALEVACDIFNGYLAKILDQAIGIVGSEINWFDSAQRAGAIAALTPYDRESLRAYGDTLLKCIYEQEFTLDF